MIYAGEPPVADNRLVWVDLEGRETPLPIPPGPFVPGGCDAGREQGGVVAAGSGNAGVAALGVPAKRGESVRLVSGLRNQNWAVWSPDGREVAFAAEEGES